VLTSVGGTVVARCGTAGAYLVSWSPQQGYEAVGVIRGPAATAQAKFGNGQRVVVMKISCNGAVPSATTSSHRVDDRSGHDT
jgi:serine/threonine-protein kinase